MENKLELANKKANYGKFVKDEYLPTISQKKLTMSVMSVGSEIFRKVGVLLLYGTVENFSAELCDSV